MSVLRGGYRRWPPKYEVLKDAFVGKRLNKKSKRQSNFYKCASCKKEFPTKEVEVDHIKPIIPIEGFTSWDITIDNLYCDKTNLQVLCLKCHEKKTKIENEERRK